MLCVTYLLHLNLGRPSSRSSPTLGSTSQLTAPSTPTDSSRTQTPPGGSLNRTSHSPSRQLVSELDSYAASCPLFRSSDAANLTTDHFNVKEEPGHPAAAGSTSSGSKRAGSDVPIPRSKAPSKKGRHS